jgi:hypothetical protein
MLKKQKRITILVSTPWMKPLYGPDCIDSKKAILKIDTPIISNYDKTIYNVRTMEYPPIDSGFKNIPANTVYMPWVSTYYYRDKKMI